MSYCTQCGHPLVEGAKFCNYCGTPAVINQQESNSSESANPYGGFERNYQPNDSNAYSQYSYTAPQTRTEEELKAEEQGLLNKISIGLKHEALAWRIGGIVFLAYSVIMILLGIFSASSAEATENLISGIIYLPIGIIDLIMAAKVSNLRNIVYTDCTKAIRHYTPGSIVMGALFNSIAMIFVIVYMVQVKNNKAVTERIIANQTAYNSQQY